MNKFHQVICACVVLILLPTIAQSGEDDQYKGFRIGTIIGSNHWDDRDWNEDQNGIYLCWKQVCAGEYDNSFSESFGNGKMESRYLLWEYRLGRAGPFEFSSVLGVVDGYEGEWDYRPFGGLTMTLGVIKVFQFGKVSAYGIELNSENMFE